MTRIQRQGWSTWFLLVGIAAVSVLRVPPSAAFVSSSFLSSRTPWFFRGPLESLPTDDHSSGVQERVAVSSSSPLSWTLEQLADVIGGKGRAQACWDAYRMGLDPLLVENSDLPTPLGTDARFRLLQHSPHSSLQNVARLVETYTSSDGTCKLLLELNDQLQVEAVLIPWPLRQSSTLCVSSQVGCRQGCTFCATGRMGKLRSLSTDEILAQFHWAQRLIHASPHHPLEEPGILQNNNNSLPLSLHPIENVVFMGMGEPADNVPAVVQAVTQLTDARLYGLAPRKVTISTVGPTPESFHALSRTSGAALAWSVHASRDRIRKQLVPTTKHTMVELRRGLMQALLQRSRRLRTVLVEVALLRDINDSDEDARHLAAFCQPLCDIPGGKVVVNLISWNDIRATQFRSPTPARVLQFQQCLLASSSNPQLRCYIRTTRGDDERAACGQLATTRRRPTTS